MKQCTNHQDKRAVAKGLCQSCYDAQPHVKARRVERARMARRFSNYKNTPEFRAYVAKYKETEEYKRWKLDYINEWKRQQKAARRERLVPRPATPEQKALKAEYMRNYYKNNPEQYQKMRERQAQYRERNREKIRAQQRALYWAKKTSSQQPE